MPPLRELCGTVGGHPAYPYPVLCSGPIQGQVNGLHKEILLEFDPPPLAMLLLNLCSKSNQNFCNFLLDCSTLPEIILATQIHEP